MHSRRKRDDTIYRHYSPNESADLGLLLTKHIQDYAYAVANQYRTIDKGYQVWIGNSGYMSVAENLGYLLDLHQPEEILQAIKTLHEKTQHEILSNIYSAFMSKSTKPHFEYNDWCYEWFLSRKFEVWTIKGRKLSENLMVQLEILNVTNCKSSAELTGEDYLACGYLYASYRNMTNHVINAYTSAVEKGILPLPLAAIQFIKENHEQPNKPDLAALTCANNNEQLNLLTQCLAYLSFAPQDAQFYRDFTNSLDRISKKQISALLKKLPNALQISLYNDICLKQYSGECASPLRTRFWKQEGINPCCLAKGELYDMTCHRNSLLHPAQHSSSLWHRVSKNENAMLQHEIDRVKTEAEFFTML